jgi:hypothetical protein
VVWVRQEFGALTGSRRRLYTWAGGLHLTPKRRGMLRHIFLFCRSLLAGHGEMPRAYRNGARQSIIWVSDR